MKRRSIISAILFAFGIIQVAGCGNNNKSDAYGNFEATEVLISAEASGKLLEFKAEEGQSLKAGQVVGVIDTVQLHLKRQQLKAQRQAMNSKVANVLSQIAVLQQQKDNALKEKDRFERLVRDKAVPTKQLDDVLDQINVIQKQIRATETQNTGILGEVKALDAQVAQLDDQIKKSVIHNPIDGVVLTKYAEPNEVTAYGKPLYKIADLKTVFLRAYLSGTQVPHIKIGQKVAVLIDEDKSNNRTLEGEISWVSEKAEFTPKIIQTKDERVNMVYAVKVRVKNDGALKIGMPGELRFNKD
jgi:HlyD family secretion protein